MPKICYTPRDFSADRLSLISTLDSICSSHYQRGYVLTLRQLFYQCVTRNMIPNKQEEYNKLGTLVSDARLAGLIDWSHIIDLTRDVMAVPHQSRPSSAIKSIHDSYRTDKWLNQDVYVEVWIEKQALEGVVSRKCAELDVPLFSCRGYTSLSSMWAAATRFLDAIQRNKKIQIIHLGDHDPSGIDMSRDIKARLNTFISAHTGGEESISVLRAALNIKQIERLNPPPNPAKMSDSRAASYVQEYGEHSWELDAIDPDELNEILERAVLLFRDENKWEEAIKLESRGKKTLEALHDQFPEVIKFLRGEIV